MATKAQLEERIEELEAQLKRKTRDLRHVAQRGKRFVRLVMQHTDDIRKHEPSCAAHGLWYKLDHERTFFYNLVSRPEYQ